MTRSQEHLERIKAILDVKNANCLSCFHIDYDVAEGFQGAYLVSFCMNDNVENNHIFTALENFPFENDRPECWEPSIWYTNFFDELIKSDANDEEIFRKFKDFLKVNWPPVKAGV